MCGGGTWRICSHWSRRQPSTRSQASRPRPHGRRLIIRNAGSGASAFCSREGRVSIRVIRSCGLAAVGVSIVDGRGPAGDSEGARPASCCPAVVSGERRNLEFSDGRFHKESAFSRRQRAALFKRCRVSFAIDLFTQPPPRAALSLSLSLSLSVSVSVSLSLKLGDSPANLSNQPRC